MKNLFWGNIEEIIKVSGDIPDKNLFILKSIYPDAEIIKETSHQINIGKENESCGSGKIKGIITYSENISFNEEEYAVNKVNGTDTTICSYKIAA